MTLEQTALILEKTFRQALATCHKRNKIYYDLFVAIDYTEGRFTISDEDDNILAEEILFDYAQGGEKEALGIESNTRELKKILRSIVEQLYDENLFDDSFGEPLSIVYLANNKEDSDEELLFVHDDQTLIDTPLLEHLDEDLDEFFRTLLDE